MSALGKGLSIGCSIGLGLVGLMATQPEMGIGGLLAGLGFNVIDSQFNPKMSSKLAQRLMPNHLVAIHNFKEKHNLE